MPEINPPTGMRLVTKDDFFAALYEDNRDIMPSVREPLHTTWETKNREVWGWSYPGWKNTGEPQLYALRKTQQPYPTHETP